MSYTLRPYQLGAVNTAVSRLRGRVDKPFIIQAATGAGKSLIIADICRQMDEPTLILQPSKELVEQNYAKLKSYGSDLDIGIYSASLNSREIRKYTYATINSIYRKPELFQQFKNVIIDECHQVNPKNLGGMYTKFLKDIGTLNVCGLTATPYRMQEKFFEENGERFYTSHLKMINRIHPFFFKEVAYKIETQELIDQGYLAPVRYYRKHVDWSQLEVNKTGSNFTEESVERFWNDQRMKDLYYAMQLIDKHCKRNLIFASSMKQADNILDMLKGMNMSAGIVTAKTPVKDRELIVDAYRRGDFKHMVNVGVFTTGFDVPELDSVCLARPTMSLALYYQMVGRGVRIDPNNPGKKLHVFDFAGNVDKLGRVETIRIEKEDDGFRDKVMSEIGRMDETPLFKFVVKNGKYGGKK
jgi:DNA repair protein RadD